MYKVQKIIGRRLSTKKKGSYEYLIKWQGWDQKDSTWEPKKHLEFVMDMVQEYDKQREEMITAKQHGSQQGKRHNQASIDKRESSQDQGLSSVYMIQESLGAVAKVKRIGRVYQMQDQKEKDSQESRNKKKKPLAQNSIPKQAIKSKFKKVQKNAQLSQKKIFAKQAQADSPFPIQSSVEPQKPSKPAQLQKLSPSTWQTSQSSIPTFQPSVSCPSQSASLFASGSSPHAKQQPKIKILGMKKQGDQFWYYIRVNGLSNCNNENGNQNRSSKKENQNGIGDANTNENEQNQQWVPRSYMIQHHAQLLCRFYQERIVFSVL